jgi:hypothetical protein
MPRDGSLALALLGSKTNVQDPILAVASGLYNLALKRITDIGTMISKKSASHLCEYLTSIVSNKEHT